jgi:hypothetical protein
MTLPAKAMSRPFRHQAPAHLIIPDDGQQAAMQDAELLAKHPPDNKQGFD